VTRPEPERVIALEYARPGKPTVTYRERLLVDRPDVKVLSMEIGPKPLTIAASSFEPGSSITWFVFPGQWHDIGRFQRADGKFAGWYTNLCTPVVIDGDHWSVTDLFLDLWMPAAGHPQWLDEDEFAAAIAQGSFGADLAQAAGAERVRIDDRVAAGTWPPDICRSWRPAGFR
jgi:predicted RNA-binding protein associated with RNAse of E/G family